MTNPREASSSKGTHESIDDSKKSVTRQARWRWMKTGPAIESRSGGRSGRFLPRVVRFGFGLGLGLALGLGNELLAIPSQVLLNLLLLRLVDGGRLGTTSSIPTPGQQAGDAKCEHEEKMRPHATPGIVGSH